MSTTNEIMDDFSKAISKVGLVNPTEHENLWQIAKRCSKYGIPKGVPTAIIGASAGTFIIPGVGTIKGATAGFLVGMLSVSIQCVNVNLQANEHLRNELKELSDKWSKSKKR